ncbi:MULTISPECIES: TOMM precursor leader peptide-binding protein [unclassified Prochlorococcus]|uniref:TOMM precursor leader peptide-binding protein n=1 Tax=unclassified Prochlorococcus TaxID=2627481 RepID=UPI0005337A94|nr:MULTISPECIES: TOMM precursor leader peptide-binding protein [unclassified Prochlorococcus]KGG26424.1 TOMM biosynthesis cyclodehydratase (protein C) [Prochlorococcus sp. MIT 0702]
MSSLRAPQLKPHFDPLLLSGEGVLLLRENGAHALYGNLYEQLIPLLDGSHSTDAIVELLSADYKKAQVYFALITLQARGYLCEAVSRLSPAEASFWAELEVDPEQACRLVEAARVEVIAVGAVDSTPVLEALRSNGIALAEGGEESSLALVMCDDYLNEEVVELNQRFRQQGRRWLLLRPRGRQLWLGPLFSGDQPGCHACLARWLRRQRPVERFVASQREAPLSALIPRAASEASTRMLAQLAALEVKRVLANATPVCDGHLISFDCADYGSIRHELLVDPHCPVCGSPAEPIFRPVTLESCPVAFDQDGGHRHIAPEETLQRFERFISPITGVVSEVRQVENELSSVHVYIAGQNSAQGIESLDDLRRNLRSCSAGKGASDVQARASALCEALERFSGERHGEELVERGSLRTMQERHGDAAIHPNAVMRFSAHQYNEREALNASGSRFNRVCEPLDPELEIEWTPIWSLSHCCRRYLPTQLLYMGPSPREEALDSPSKPAFIAMGCSNGNASGNTLEEAVLQGFLELVERDSTAIWWYNLLRHPGVDLASCQDIWINRLINDYAVLGRELWALDITADLGIPCIVALSRLTHGEAERIVFGLGCHLDPRIAVQRALAEMNQMLGIANADLGKDDQGIDDTETLTWLKTATLENQPYLKPDEMRPLRRLEDFPQRHSGDLLQDIDYCRGCVEAQGLEMLVLNQTRPLIGIPVVKVVVPGLRHFWARHAAGRLFDVPVQMGWLEQPLQEDELNPIPIFF